MRKKDVEIGATYTAKVSGQVVPIQILRESPNGGWDAVNQKTNRTIWIRSGARLRRRVK